VTDFLSKLCTELSAWFLFISTDYVFDGKNPPYATNAETNPLNTYGKMKREAELIIWKNQHDAGILRVPVLYGPVENLEESAVTILLKSILSKESEVQIDNLQIRYPTNVNDVTNACFGLAQRKLEHCGLYGTWHLCGPDKFTKYEMAIEIAKILELPYDHLKPSFVPNPKIPLNAQLNCIAIEVMGLRKKTPFVQGIKSVLEPWVQKK